MYVEVAVCLPLTRTFIYETPEPVPRWCRVEVPFKRNQVEAFVLSECSTLPEGVEARQILSVLDPEPLIHADVFRLCHWISDYYLAPLGEVLKSALPPGITRKHIDRKASHSTAERDRRPARSAESELHLTREQNAAVVEIESLQGFGAVLLHGVTGSGKTEVYLRAVETALARNRTALVLVPEIGLTPQLADRFRVRFGDGVAVLHSSLTRRQRIDEWLRIHTCEVAVVVGTRSAVFAPLRNLGLVVVDEEHETSYKQEEMPRYHARDTAIVRAKFSSAAVVLGSATPAMESYRNAQEGKYRLVRLTERVEERALPSVEIVNMREEYVSEGRQVLFSKRLLEALRQRVEQREQAIVLLNRRGYAAFLVCRHCGVTQSCTNCSVSMTYHRRMNRLLCHYCGQAKHPPERCPECGSEYIFYVGEGTERVESELAELLPGVRIGRVDRDTMKNISDFERVLGAFRSGEKDLLVGTQMIAKGHDFPNVTLVGVLGADSSLSIPDFRSAERTFQLLTQVAGRSGRGDKPGEVVIQSYFPDHYAFQLAVSQRFEDFYARESGFRRSLFYPPFASLAGILVQDRDNARARETANDLYTFLDRHRNQGIRILGPAPAPLEKLKRVHRHQMLIKAVTRSHLHRALRELQQYLEEKKVGRRVLIDVDPVSLM